MDKAELKKELDHMVDQMPVPLVREILDFAEFLLAKGRTESNELEEGTLSRAEAEHLEEEFANYKALYPKRQRNV
ncbi:DUF2281 domain-containing protein [Telluribacter sp.]|uniref:DUF2281 domain-containing protein n=1 Tax=Telluribacter sp. TaxID=1978767 RepID=UPI002E10B8B3|nr:DUF2281 domain-containing protein [Telluribacter sp.]